MAVLTAQQLKDRESPEWTIDLGNGDEVVVRRPDIQALIFEGIFPTALVNAMVKSVAIYKGMSGADVTTDMMSTNTGLREFVNTWVCAATVLPRLVMPLKDGETKPADTVLVSDLTLDTRTKIFNATFYYKTAKYQADVAAAERFPADGPSEGIRPDGAAIRTETEPDFMYG